MSAALMALVPFLRGYGFVFTQTISADTSNYNLRTAALAAGWDGAAPLFATVTINSGIVVSATSTGSYAFDTDLSYPAGSTLALVCAGYICGMGGAGGAGSSPSGVIGLPGGPALRAQYPISIDATGGTIAGGGGGGGGHYGTNPYISSSEGCGGGGGRTGRTSSSGGYAYPYRGNDGSFSAAGADKYNPTQPYGSGGAGGNWGSGGSAGYLGQAGGAAGAAVVGNANITWLNTGNRYGPIS